MPVVVRLESPYQQIFVEDLDAGYNRSGFVAGQDGVRALRFDLLRQSAVRLVDGEPDPTLPPVFRYIRCLDLIRWYNPEGKKFLYLGLGAGVAPSRLLSFAPDADIQAVELDEVVVRTAEDWFGFDSKRIKTHVADVFEWLPACNEKFDVIVVDICFDDSVPTQITSREFMLETLSKLEDGGVVAMNLIGALAGPKSDSFQSTLQTFHEVFEDVHVYPINNELRPLDLTNQYTNVEVFASNQKLDENIARFTDLGGMTTDAVLRKIIRDRYYGTP